jgi:hypothetical protein
MSSHSRWEELAAGHALNALEPEEEHDFLRHLRGCDLCVRTLAEMNTVGAELSYAVEPAEPPPALLSSIMDAVRREDRPVLVPATRIDVTRHDDELLSRRQRRDGVRSRLGLRGGATSWLTRAAAVILVIVLGLWNATLRSEVRTQDQQLALRAQLEELVTSPGTRVISLGQPGAPAYGSAIVHDRRVMLVVNGLGATEGRAAYVLWARGSSPTMVAVQKFGISNPGRPNVIPEMQLPDVDGAVVELAVTQELIGPGDDLPETPSGTPFLRGQLA